MHQYVRDVIDRIPNETDGRGGYLRVSPDGDQERVRAFLTEERDAAQAMVNESSVAAGRLVQYGVPMQMLILTELMLTDLTKPVDLRAVCIAQGQGSSYVSERIEEAAKGLAMMSRHVEVTGQL